MLPRRLGCGTEQPRSRRSNQSSRGCTAHLVCLISSLFSILNAPFINKPGSEKETISFNKIEQCMPRTASTSLFSWSDAASNDVDV